MRMRIVWLCLIAGACASNSQSSERKDSISGTTGDWAATLSERNGSAVRGTVRLQSAVIGSGGNIAITGATPGASHPWHVHVGRCGGSGSMVGSPGSYPVLTVGTDGTASANVTIGTALSEGTAYSVDVHRSSTDMGTIIACGDLRN